MEIFFFPILVATAEALKHAELRLWTPLIFGGYPLFADGEAGMLYPLNLLVLPWATPEQALLLLPVLHTFLSAAFTYYLARTLGLGAFPGVVAGLVYALSGFAAGQAVHANVMRSLAWLPLELALIVRMCEATGATRLRYAVLGGAVFGVQALALHIHITLLSALAVGAFVLYRWAASFTRPRALWLRQGLFLGACLGTVGIVGMGLAAVQLLPLGELATETYRGAGLSSALSAPNSIWPGDLVTLLLPRLHDVGNRDYWGPWVKWETMLYIGVMPLALVGVGLAGRRRSGKMFFALLMLGSLLAGFGSYGPLPLWDWLHALPGFNVLKSPGRFSLLFSLGAAIMAAYGLDNLMRAIPSRRRALAIMAGSVLVVAVGSAALGLASGRLEVWSRTGSILVEQYLWLPGVPTVVDGARLTSDRLALYASKALDPSNPNTAGQLALVLASGFALSLWFMGARVKLVAGALAGILVFVDLWVLGLGFHPSVPVAALRPQVPGFLRPTDASQFRVLTIPTDEEKVTQVDPNRLMVLGIPEAGGYSSLPPDRASSYMGAVLQTDDGLLDLWNVRYVIKRHRAELQPAFEGVSFHPTRPLLQGKNGDAGHSIAFRPAGGPARGDELLVVAALRDAKGVRDGEQAALIRLEGADGRVRSAPLVVGRDVSDATINVPGATGFSHQRAEVAFDHQRSNPDGDRYGEQIFVGRLPLNESFVLTRATIEQTLSRGRLQVSGLGFYDARVDDVTQVWDREDRPIVYQDEEITVRENRGYLPRAFIVHDAVVLPPGVDPLERMHDGPFDPHRTVILEGPLPDGLEGLESRLARSGEVNLNAPTVKDTATIERYEDEHLVIRTQTSAPGVLVVQDAYLPGWVARIDGKRAPLLRANYLFRAVPIPAGEHRVTFTYEPQSVAIGLIITLCTAAAILGFLSWGLWRQWRRVRS